MSIGHNVFNRTHPVNRKDVAALDIRLWTHFVGNWPVLSFDRFVPKWDKDKDGNTLYKIQDVEKPSLEFAIPVKDVEID